MKPNKITCYENYNKISMDPEKPSLLKSSLTTWKDWVCLVGFDE